ncbi:unnamed protein product [Phaeothamnion confervicola]
MLVTWRQFPPHDAPTVFRTNGNGTGEPGGDGGDGGMSSVSAVGGGSGDGGLLSAQDKIAELTGLLDNAQVDIARMSKDLEEIQAEKVSMEFLLREKLERLVQAEIEGRLSYMTMPAVAGAADPLALAQELAATRQAAATWAAEAAELRARLAALQPMSLPLPLPPEKQRPSAEASEIVRLQAENASLQARAQAAEAEAAAATAAVEAAAAEAVAVAAAATAEGGASSCLLGELQERCASLACEREAMQTIMEQKIKVLVDNVADSVMDLSLDAQAAAADGSVGLVSLLGGEAQQALDKDVGALRSLVEAAIVALRNAAQEDHVRAAAAATRSLGGGGGAVSGSATGSGAVDSAVMAGNALRGEETEPREQLPPPLPPSIFGDAEQLGA